MIRTKWFSIKRCASERIEGIHRVGDDAGRTWTCFGLTSMTMCVPDKASHITHIE